MGMKRLRSRTHEVFTEKAMADLFRLCKDRSETDNNKKADTILRILDSHNIDYVELGPGTNRMAVLVGNYVYKIAMDDQGLLDNINEFKISKELQPFVVKTYETNELFSVHEYVTLISREEFVEKPNPIKKILSILAETYLLGDVGYIPKNFCNWGYRDDGSLVILDFAHVYRVNPDQLVCTKDGTILEYDDNFHFLVCPLCARKYTFMEIRRRLSLDNQIQENIIAKELSYMLTEPIQEFKDKRDGYKEDNSSYNKNSDDEENKEDTEMDYRDDKLDKDRQEDSYEATREELIRSKRQGKEIVQEVVSIVEPISTVREIRNRVRDEVVILPPDGVTDIPSPVQVIQIISTNSPVDDDSEQLHETVLDDQLSDVIDPEESENHLESYSDEKGKEVATIESINNDAIDAEQDTDLTIIKETKTTETLTLAEVQHDKESEADAVRVHDHLVLKDTSEISAAVISVQPDEEEDPEAERLRQEIEGISDNQSNVEDADESDTMENGINSRGASRDQNRNANMKQKGNKNQWV